MSRQKYLTPIVVRKHRGEQREEELETVTTETYKQRRNANYNLFLPQTIKTNPSFSLDKISTRALQIAKTNLIPDNKRQPLLKLPSLKKKKSNPEDPQTQNSQRLSKTNQPKVYYQSSLACCLRKLQTTYLMNLYRQHFYQCIQVLRQAKSFKIPHPRKDIKLPRKNNNFKTVYLDLDQTLVHCDQNTNNYTVKLTFPLEKGGTLAAGIRIRPFCRQFLQQLSQFAEIIIFTASSSSYADVILDYLDPEKKYISHRLYRQHCTLQKGFFLKDLRVVNRKLSQVVLLDNSPYCHLLQPENGIPIVPFYHYPKDRELQSVLEYLRMVLAAEDTRNVILNTFFWDKYINEPGEPRRLFFKYLRKTE